LGVEASATPLTHGSLATELAGLLFLLVVPQVNDTKVFERRENYSRENGQRAYGERYPLW